MRLEGSCLDITMFGLVGTGRDWEVRLGDEHGKGQLGHSCIWSEGA